MTVVIAWRMFTNSLHSLLIPRSHFIQYFFFLFLFACSRSKSGVCAKRRRRLSTIYTFFYKQALLWYNYKKFVWKAKSKPLKTAAVPVKLDSKYIGQTRDDDIIFEKEGKGIYPLTARRLRPLRWEMNCVCYLLDRAS